MWNHLFLMHILLNRTWLFNEWLFMTVIDDYLTTIEPSKRRELERIRALARQIVPDAEDAIVYGMPTLKYQARHFLGLTLINSTLASIPIVGR